MKDNKRRAGRIAMVRFVLLVAFVATIGCGGERSSSGTALITVFDSTLVDTVIARTTGVVSAEQNRSFVELVRIEPDAEDTTLFADIWEFDVGRDDRIYAFDYISNVLFIFDSSGELLRRVGRKGGGPGEFGSNAGMVVLPDGRVAIWDSNNSRVSIFSESGDFERSWVAPSGFSTVNGLHTDRSGTLYMSRPVTDAREGEFIGRIGLVRLIDGGGFSDSLIPPDLPVQRVAYIAEQGGGRSSVTPQYSPQLRWEWHPDGHFVSVSTERYQIESSRPGRALRIVREGVSVPVSADERAAEEERIIASMRMTDPSWVMRGPPLPSAKAPLAGLFVSVDGRIWASVATESELIPEDERDAPRPNRPPPLRHRAPTVYEVYSAEGEFLWRIKLPTNSRLMAADGDRLWLLQRTADGMTAIVAGQASFTP